MSHIHVCLVSDQPIPNLTTALQFQPDKVILLTTKEMERKATWLRDVLNEKGFQTEQRLLSAYEINDVMQKCEDLLDQLASASVTLNITGGTKIGTLGSFQVFYTRDKPIYYVNTRDNKIMQLFPEDKQSGIPIRVTIPIKDYLSVYGFKMKGYLKDDSLIYKRKKATDYLAYIAVNAENVLGDINFRLQGYEDFAYPYEINIKPDEKTRRLCAFLEEAGLVNLKGNTTIDIPDVGTARYLAGMWFEEYVYMTAKSLAIDEIKLNVKGAWDIAGKHVPRNEFDVLLSKGNRLFYISCKTANPERKMDDSGESVAKEYLYELDSISDKALGIFGKGMLASAREIRNDYVRKRAELLQIQLVHGRGINTLKEAIRQWISSP